MVILSDGWERADPALVGREMERLRLMAHRVVWVNPRAGAAGFSPGTGGMAAALPHCDAMVSGHSLEAMYEVAEAIAGDDVLQADGPGWPAEALRGSRAVMAERRADRGAAAGAHAQRLRAEARKDDELTKPDQRSGDG